MDALQFQVKMQKYIAIGWHLSQPDSKYGYESVTMVVLPLRKHGWFEPRVGDRKNERLPSILMSPGQPALALALDARHHKIAIKMFFKIPRFLWIHGGRRIESL